MKIVGKDGYETTLLDRIQYELENNNDRAWRIASLIERLVEKVGMTDDELYDFGVLNADEATVRDET